MGKMNPGGGMMGWGGYGYGMGNFGWLFMLAFWGLLIVGVVFVVRWLRDSGRPGTGAGPGGAPRDIPK